MHKIYNTNNINTKARQRETQKIFPEKEKQNIIVNLKVDKGT